MLTIYKINDIIIMRVNIILLNYMKKFLLGFIIGIFLTSLTCFSSYISPRMRIMLGHILDKDTIYLNDGRVFHGWITKEGDEEIIIEVANGYFTFSQSQVEGTNKDYLLKYTRELI